MVLCWKWRSNHTFSYKNIYRKGDCDDPKLNLEHQIKYLQQSVK